MEQGLKISELMARTGVTRATVHHYVHEGLLPAPRKTGRNMALYDEGCVERIVLIQGLQRHYRRSLAEVKAMLDGTSGEGLARLRALVQPAPQAAVEVGPSRDELCRQTGFTAVQIEQMGVLGLVDREASLGRAPFRRPDVDVVVALHHLDEAGLDKQHGFSFADVVLYVEALRGLLRQEIDVFLEHHASQKGDPEEMIRLAAEGIRGVTPLLIALRARLVDELFAGAAPPDPEGQ